MVAILLVLPVVAYAVPAFGQSTIVLTVNTQYSTGQPINGLWTTLAQNGQVVATGFSPARFNLVPGQQYVVTVSNYQTYIFERWQDTGSPSAARSISISQASTITALYQAPGGSSQTVVHMSDTTAVSGSVTYAGRQVNAEYVTPSSQLVGDRIDSITVRLQRIGAPPGTFQVGVFNADLTPKRSFAIASTSTLSTSFQDYEFKLPSGELYTIAAGDRIGVKYNGGSTANAISVMIDRNFADPFDGTNSYRTRYESGWLVDSGEDLYMILKQGSSGGGTTPPPTGNARPTANGQSLSVNENSGPRTITLSGSDSEGQPIRFFIASQPAHGILGVVNQNTVTYRPYDYYDGPDSFTFVTNDGSQDSLPATVNVSVANTAAKTTSQAVIISVDPQGHTVSGFWTTLSQNGVQVNADWTHVAFNVNNGQQYVVSPSAGYGEHVFDRWQDTGSTNPSRTISITRDTPFIAVYRTT
jgi:hypothetical protein